MSTVAGATVNFSSVPFFSGDDGIHDIDSSPGNWLKLVREAWSNSDAADETKIAKVYYRLHTPSSAEQWYDANKAAWKTTDDFSNAFSKRFPTKASGKQFPNVTRLPQDIPLSAHYGLDDWISTMFNLLCTRRDGLSAAEQECLMPTQIIAIYRARETFRTYIVALRQLPCLSTESCPRYGSGEAGPDPAEAFIMDGGDVVDNYLAIEERYQEPECGKCVRDRTQNAMQLRELAGILIVKCLASSEPPTIPKIVLHGLVQRTG